MKDSTASQFSMGQSSMNHPSSSTGKWCRRLFCMILVGSLLMNFAFGYIFLQVVQKGTQYMGIILSKAPEISFTVSKDATRDWLLYAYGNEDIFKEYRKNTQYLRTQKNIHIKETETIKGQQFNNEFEIRAKQLFVAFDNLGNIPFDKEQFVRDALHHNRQYLNVMEKQLWSFAEFWAEKSLEERTNYLTNGPIFKHPIQRTTLYQGDR